MFIERYPQGATGEGIVPGAIKGVYTIKQPGYAEEYLPDDDEEVKDFLARLTELPPK
jgi:hypothetical protein